MFDTDEIVNKCAVTECRWSGVLKPDDCETPREVDIVEILTGSEAADHFISAYPEIDKNAS